MKKILIFFFVILLFFILIGNKPILSNLAIFSFEKWTNKEIFIEDFDISYGEKEISLKNIVVRDSKNSSLNIFTAEKITLSFQPNSFFTKLILIDDIRIQKPVLNLNFNFSNKVENSKRDNIGIYKSIEQKLNPKIYPKKIIDINFLIENLDIKEFKVNITRLDNYSEETIVITKMSFEKFGNELGYQHYKDIFKIILIDLVMRISDQKLKKIIKSYYLS